MIKRPIIIIGAPRSGTTIVRRCLAMHPVLWHLPAESHMILEGPLDPRTSELDSNRVLAHDIGSKLVSSLQSRFYEKAINLNFILSNPGIVFSADHIYERILSKLTTFTLGNLSKLRKPSSIRLLEKTPKNSLRVSLMNRIFPDALFVWNRREPEPNIDSLIDGWYATDEIGPITLDRYARAGYSIAGQLDLKDYSGRWWKFALVPDWRSLEGCTVGEVAAWQYYQCERHAENDLSEIENDRVFEMRHEDFVNRPLELTSKILAQAGLSVDPVVKQFANELPQVNTTSGCNQDCQSGLRHPDQVQRGIEMIPSRSDM